MEISDVKIVKNLWKLPDCGKISNPYFVRPKNDSNVIPCIEIDDNASVNTPSTTDESDDSINNDQTKVNGVKIKRRSKRKEAKKETITSEQDPIDVSSAISKEDKDENIPGLGSLKLTTTIEEIQETTTATIKDKRTRSISQSSLDNLVKPIEIDHSQTKANNINKEPTQATITGTVTNGTSMETQQKNDQQQLNDKPKCIRIGCCNSAIENPDWDFEYCSSKCAVEHCKTAFLNWVTTRQLESVNSTSTTTSTTTTTTITT